MSLLKLGISEIKKGLDRRDFSAVDLTQTYLAQIEKTKALNAYIKVTPERAMQDAEESDKRLARGQGRALEGVPLGAKDAFCTKGIPTTAASKILSSFVPPYESTITQKLADAGTILLGKTNLDEFCMGSTTTPPFTGPSYNPWNPSCTAGGSSGGGAVAVASGAALVAVGTDTGGSLRQPASFCGIVGLRPTYGRCSRWGIVAYASSLDQAGPLTRSVEDAALLLEAMAGHDPKDSTSSPQEVPCFSKALGQSIKGLRIGIPREWYENVQLQPEIASLWDWGQKLFQELGCQVTFISLPYSSYSLPCYYILACAEAASNLQRYDGVKYGFRAEADTLEEMYLQTRGQGFGTEVKRRILLGTFVLSHGYYEAYYHKAQRVRRVIQQEFTQAFQDVDVILAPTTPTAAFPLEEMSDDPVTIYHNDLLTVPVNVGHCCAISVPAGLSTQGLPLGLQLIAPAFQEERLFQFGYALEQHREIPPLPFE